MNPSAELVHDLLAALDEVHGLHPATLATAGRTRWGRTQWGWNWDALAIHLAQADDGQTMVVRVVATRLPLPPVVREAERALLAVLTASALPVTRLRLEITDIDATAFG